MNKLKTFVLGSCIALLGIGLSSCFKEKTESCESYVKFRYDYNLLKADAFHTQATSVDLYLFDSEGVLVRKSTEQVPEGLEDNTFLVKLPRDLKTVTQMVAWAGANSDLYTIPAMTVGTSTIQDLKVAINATAGSEVKNNYPNLLWGYVKIEGGIKYKDEITVIPMRKNTNTFRIALRAHNYDFDMDVDNFSFRIIATDGSYDYLNKGYDDKEWSYVPFYTATETVSGVDLAVVEISMQRLITDKDIKLEIKYKPTGESIFVDEEALDLYHKDANAKDQGYLKLYQGMAYKSYELQEYLDREDYYPILILLERKTVGGNFHYLSTQISINEWVIRLQEVDK